MNSKFIEYLWWQSYSNIAIYYLTAHHSWGHWWWRRPVSMMSLGPMFAEQISSSNALRMQMKIWNPVLVHDVICEAWILFEV